MKLKTASRQFERQDVSLKARLIVNSESSEQVCFSGSAPSARGASTIGVTVVDLGYGGVGMRTQVFLPRMATAELEILEPNGADDCFGVSHDGGEPDGDESDQAVMFRHAIQVRRCQMTGRAPTYLVGAAFESPDADLRETINGFLERLSEIMQAIAQRRLAALDHEGERGA